MATLHSFRQEVQLNDLYRGRIEAERMERSVQLDLEEARAEAERERAEKEHALARRAAYQAPWLGWLTQGSAGGRAAPRWSSSMEMPSGLRTKAIRPSRGGRRMATPPSARRWQAA